MTSTGRRVGRESLIRAALALLDQVTLTDVASAVKTRSVAAKAEVAPSTVSHHFSPTGDRNDPNHSLARATIERALAEGQDITASTREELQDGAVVAASAASPIDLALAEQIAMANVRSWLAPERRVAVTARHLAYAAAPHDADARRILERRDLQQRERLEPAYRAFLEATSRTWIDGWNEQRFAVATSSMAEGFLMRQRFNPELAPVALFGSAVRRLFEGVTVERSLGDDWGAGAPARAPLPSHSTLDPHKRDAIASAAALLYDAHGWAGVTIATVSSEAGVSRATVNAHFHSRLGLAAPIFGRCIAPLDAAIQADRSTPITSVMRNHLERLATFAQQHREVTSAFLGSQHEPGYLRRGSTQAPPPVFVVPVHELLAGLAEREPERFRPGVIDTPDGLVQFSIFVTRSCLSLATGHPGITPAEVADFMHDTVLAGSMVRRPSPRSRRR